ncbi:MAG: LysR family transcriptional regulator substrate-binding protein [Atopobiaceae bacterium]|nr:LysR family transcriptional regulator substrate-binding protein [Atopobiaceae bacterium]
MNVRIHSGLVCVVRNDSPLAQRDSVGPEDVAGLPQVVSLSPGARRRGVAAQASLPATDEGHTTRCANSSEAYALVDAGYGYALVPSMYSMPDPFHKVLTWQGRARAWYGAYHRADDRGWAVTAFLGAARQAYGQEDFGDQRWVDRWHSLIQ